MYVGGAAGCHGPSVLVVEGLADLTDPAIEGCVRGGGKPVLDALGGGSLPVAESLGTDAAARAAQRSLPAVWLARGRDECAGVSVANRHDPRCGGLAGDASTGRSGSLRRLTGRLGRSVSWSVPGASIDDVILIGGCCPPRVAAVCWC